MLKTPVIKARGIFSLTIFNIVANKHNIPTILFILKSPSNYLVIFLYINMQTTVAKSGVQIVGISLTNPCVNIISKGFRYCGSTNK